MQTQLIIQLITASVMLGLSANELKIYLLVVGGLAVLSLIITGIVLLPGYISYNRAKLIDEQPVIAPIDMSLFEIPESYKQLRENEFVPFLPDKDYWSKEDVAPYWKDPKQLILEYLDKQNENYINEMFKTIP